MLEVRDRATRCLEIATSIAGRDAAARVLREIGGSIGARSAVQRMLSADGVVAAAGIAVVAVALCGRSRDGRA